MAKHLRDVKVIESSDWVTDRLKQRKDKMEKDIKAPDIDLDTAKEKSQAIAVGLSLLWTGAGHIYIGRESEGKGVILAVVYFVLAAMTVASGGILAIAFLPFWIWGIYDADKSANKYNDELKKARENRQAEQEKAEAEAERIRNETTAASDFVEQIEKVSKLHSANFLSEAEYKAKKKDLILSLLDKKPQGDVMDFFAALVPSIEKGYLTEEEVEQIKKLVQ